MKKGDVMITLIIGLPGCGKSTKAKELIKNGGLVYDLDAIAAAFTLSAPHEDNNPQARQMANDLLKGFALTAPRYHDNIVIIRTAPTRNELYFLKPDLIIYKRTNYVERETENTDFKKYRIKEVLQYATLRQIKVITE